MENSLTMLGDLADENNPKLTAANAIGKSNHRRFGTDSSIGFANQLFSVCLII
jgi:hypothetical protein